MKIFIISLIAIYAGFALGIWTSSKSSKDEIRSRLKGKLLISEEAMKTHDEMLKLVTLAEVKKGLDEEVAIFEECASDATIWSAYAVINNVEKQIKEEHDA